MFKNFLKKCIETTIKACSDAREMFPQEPYIEYIVKASNGDYLNCLTSKDELKEGETIQDYFKRKGFDGKIVAVKGAKEGKAKIKPAKKKTVNLLDGKAKAKIAAKKRK